MEKYLALEGMIVDNWEFNLMNQRISIHQKKLRTSRVQLLHVVIIILSLSQMDNFTLGVRMIQAN
jgi:hypothetical protein